MNVVMNGEPRTVREGATLADLLVELGLEGRPLAVEHNLHVVPKSKFRETRLAEGDRLEIVQAVGGG